MYAIYNHYGPTTIYTHDVDLTTFRFRTEQIMNKRTGNKAFEIRTVNMTIKIKGSSQSDIDSQVYDLKEAYSWPGLSWGFYRDDHAITTDQLPSQNLLGYVHSRVVDLPNSDRNEYATQRTFAITLEARYQIETNSVLEFEESLIFTGTGGPRFVAVETINAAPVIQQLTNYTGAYAVQSGYAVGIDAYPPYPDFIFPYPVHDAVRRKPTSPERIKNSLIKYRIDWTYPYVSTSGLTGVPNN